MDDEMAGSEEHAAPTEKKRKVCQEQGTWGNWEDTTTLKKPVGNSPFYAITDAPFPGEGGRQKGLLPIPQRCLFEGNLRVIFWN